MSMFFIVDTRAIAVCRLHAAGGHGCCECMGYNTPETIYRKHLSMHRAGFPLHQARARCQPLGRSCICGEKGCHWASQCC